ncbi:MAG: phosphate/phosphite/phosphonate ABC transporter substrate-binding protein [Verrucomicrobia bacterium]|jgi:phosphonate transport system substrate-binding protein|nr:phosphate/phosphite/phosphonate ABC transporter substrate-binding protein [Verrucomicrobiota bacterium]
MSLARILLNILRHRCFTITGFHRLAVMETSHQPVTQGHDPRVRMPEAPHPRRTTRPCPARLLRIALFALCIGCNKTNPTVEPDRLRIVVVPYRGIEATIQEYADLVNYLSTTLNLPAEFTVAPTHQAAVDAFVEGRVELALFEAGTYALATQKIKTVPLVMRDVDQRFVTILIARADDPRNSIEDFRGSTIAMGDPLSTYGYLAPKHFLALNGIPMEQFFAKRVLTGTEQWTGTFVEDKRADLAVLTSLSFERMQTTDLVKKNAMKVIWQSPPYPNYVWVVPAALTRTMQIRIRDAFLDLRLENPQHREILQSLQSGGYLPTSAEDLKVADRMIQTERTNGTLSAIER